MIQNKIVVFGNTLQNTMGLIRSLGKKGYSVDLLLEPCPKNQCFVRFSKYLNEIHYLGHMEDAVPVLLQKYANNPFRTIVFCGSDPTISLLDANYDLLKEHFVVFNANEEQGRINRFLDKENTFQLARKYGLPLVKTWYVDNLDKIPDDVSFPCFVKGNNSVKSGKWDIKICQSRDELVGFLREGVVYLVQEFVKKDAEYSVTGFSYNHGRSVVIPGVIRKVREDLVRMGEFMCLEDKRQFPTINFAGIANLVGEIGYEGIFSVDMLRKGDVFYFLEINLRNDGLAYIYTAAGANFPDLWVKYVTGQLSENEVKNLSVKTPFYVMHENDMYNIIEGKVGLVQWLSDFKKTNAFFVFDIVDIKPFLYSCWIHARQLFKKVVRFLTGIRVS